MKRNGKHAKRLVGVVVGRLEQALLPFSLPTPTALLLLLLLLVFSLLERSIVFVSSCKLPIRADDESDDTAWSHIFFLELACTSKKVIGTQQ